MEVPDDPAQVEKAKRDLIAMNKLPFKTLCWSHVHSNPLQGSLDRPVSWPIVAEEVENRSYGRRPRLAKGDGAGSFFVKRDDQLLPAPYRIQS